MTTKERVEFLRLEIQDKIEQLERMIDTVRGDQEYFNSLVLQKAFFEYQIKTYDWALEPSEVDDEM